jgi:hypothetical protein
MAQHLPNKYKALSSNHQYCRKKERQKESLLMITSGKNGIKFGMNKMIGINILYYHG